MVDGHLFAGTQKAPNEKKVKKEKEVLTRYSRKQIRQSEHTLSKIQKRSKAL